MAKRRICFVITSRVHFARCRMLLDVLRSHEGVDLQVVVGGAALLPKYGDVTGALERDGFRIDERLYTVVEGGDHVAMAKTTGLTVLEFTNAFQRLDPAIVVIRGDRFEMLAAAVAAAYMNIPIAHIEGGDLSGSIDESVRHAITKLSQFHFVTNEAARERVLRMGERPDTVWNMGSPDVEYAASAAEIPLPKLQAALDAGGIGAHLDLAKPFVMVIQHPVTTGTGLAARDVEQEQYRNALATIEAVGSLPIPALWFWPNMDAGTDALSKAIRVQREKGALPRVHFVKNLDPDVFINILRRTQCLAGNSSAGIKECSWLGVPVVDIGERQHARFDGPHMVRTGHSAAQIRAAIEAQVARGRYPRNATYYREGTSRGIAQALATAALYTQKVFHA